MVKIGKVMDRKANIVLALSGTCTISVIMTSVFAPGELPGDHGQLERFDSDTSTWRRVYEAAQTVLYECVDRQAKAGWTFLGG